MRLLDYGIWTLFVPFFTSEDVIAYNGYKELPLHPGILYHLRHSKIVFMKQCDIKGTQWDACPKITEDDHSDVQEILIKENIVYNN